MHEKYQMGKAQETIKNLDAKNLGGAYSVMRNKHKY